MVEKSSNVMNRSRESSRGRGSNNVEGGERGAGARAGEEGLLRPAACPPHRRGGAPDVVLLPRAHRRVRGHAAVPLHHGGDRHRVQGAERQGPLRRGGHPGHRVGLRRHDLRAGLLHGGHLRRAHQPCRHLRAAAGEEGLAAPRRAVHGGAERGRHRWRGHREGHHERGVRGERRRRELGGGRVLAVDGVRGGAGGHVRAGVHGVLCDGPEAQRAGLPRARAGAAAHRVRGLHGAPGHHPHHRHRHQPRKEPRRRRHLQQEGGLGRPLDLLGWPVRGSAGCGGVPPVHPPGGGHQGARLLQEQPEQLSCPAGR